MNNNKSQDSKIWESYNAGYPVDTWEEGQEPQMTWNEYFGGLNQILDEARQNIGVIEEQDLNQLIQNIQQSLGQLQQAVQQQAATSAGGAGGQAQPQPGPQKPGIMARMGQAAGDFVGAAGVGAWNKGKEMLAQQG